MIIFRGGIYGLCRSKFGKNESIVSAASVNMIAILPNAILAVLVLVICASVGGFFVGLIAAALIVGMMLLRMKTRFMHIRRRLMK